MVDASKYLTDRTSSRYGDGRLDENTRGLRDAMGVAGTYIAGAFMDAMSSYVGGAANMASDMGSAWNWMKGQMSGFRYGETTEDAIKRRIFDASDDSVPAIDRPTMDLFPIKSFSDVGDDRSASRQRTTEDGEPHHDHVQLTVKGSDDPDRVAKS